MPSSTYKIINQTVEEILKTDPKSILEVGIGFGKYGFLAREYLETWKDNVFPEQWKVRIDGIEIFKPYTELEHLKPLYNTIYVGDAFEVTTRDLGKYELSIAMDIIEHLPKDKGTSVVKNLIALTEKKCIINVPTGNWMGNKVVAENPAEQHQAIWEPEDFEAIAQEMGVVLEKTIWKQGGRFGCLAIFTK